MRRQALVVGINRYPGLKETPTSDTPDLKTAVSDAEAIARLLELYGSFKVERLPHRHVDASQFDSTGLVTAKELKIAITQLFLPEENNTPDAGLLFFAGIGLSQPHQNGQTEGFLATSDTNPRRGRWGISLKELRQWLQNSPVQQQIVWLDCSHSGEFLKEIEAETVRRDRCFIVAASDKSQKASAYQGRGLLTTALCQRLNLSNSDDKMVTNYLLEHNINDTLGEGINKQNPRVHNRGNSIILTVKPIIPQVLLPQEPHPLDCLWEKTNGWFSETHSLMKHNFDKDCQYSTYKDEVNKALGIDLPGEWWNNPKSAHNLYESLKSLCGETFSGWSKRGDRHISVGAAYLIALMAHQASCKHITPLIEGISDWEGCEKASRYFIFPVQISKDAAASAKALYDVFKFLFERQGLTQDSQVERVFFEPPGNQLTIQFKWSAKEPAKDNPKTRTLAKFTSSIMSKDQLLIEPPNNTSNAILKLWSRLFVSENGFMSPGVIYMNEDQLVIASLGS
ncbi:caspase family protein [Coleofasciculus chthonoplastes]|uniref:caspase family protein n=1 Tax=Coleofasciculus chthonoplastes TaxID=64178 RepID=UPI0003068063|nr:caspase family protein [Coleofasciculus chthonoplastes]